MIEYLKFSKISLKYLISWAIERISQELKNEFESATIKESSVFEFACQLLITCSVVSATADCRKNENFLRKKNNTTDRNVKKGPKSFYLILMKQKPKFSAGFSAQNATSKNISNCNLNELFVS